MSDSEYDVEPELYPSETGSELPTPKRNDNKGRNMGIIAGILVVGAGIATAIAARFMSKSRTKSTQQSAVRRSTKGHSSTRRKLPPRRPRSIVSGASSLPQSPTASSSSTPVKSQLASQGAAPSLPPRPKFVARQKHQVPLKSKDETEKQHAVTVPDQQVDAMKDNYDHKANEKKVEQDSESGVDKNTAPKDKPEEPLKSAANEVADTIAVPSAAAKDEKPLISGPLEEVKPLDPEHGVELEKETGGKDDDKPASAVEVKQSHHFDPEAGNAETLPAVGATNVAQGNAATVEVAEAPGRQVNDEVEKGTEVNDKLDENMQKDGVAADEQEEQQEEQKEESDDDFERIEDISCPTLDFSNAPQSSEPLTALEERIRNMSIAAHNHLSRDKLTKLGQAIKEQESALDLALGEGEGKVRPTLVAACAFSLADMLVALRKIDETKGSLAIAYAAGKHTENRGPMIRALMNYAYVLRGSGKPRSARAAYLSALDIARAENGPSHQTVEQIKYEYSSYLAKTGKLGEASQFLLGEADALLAQAEKLDAEDAEREERGETQGETTHQEDPGSGLEHIQAEVEAQTDPSLSLKPGDQARHYVMRNLMNAAGLLDNKGDHETAETALTKAVEIAIRVHGENSVHHMNTLYAMGLHYRGRGALQDAIAAFETVLSIMDETIEVYEPELLQNRIAILRDAAVCYDEVGDPVTAVDYATGAVVNAQTLAKIMTANGAPRAAGDAMLEPFWLLLADLKAKAGDADGAAEARREALRGKLNQGIASRGRSGGGMQRSGGSGLKRSSAGGATRAGGRRV